MTTLTLPPEGTYSDIEHDLIENEPPGLFPTGQDSAWGQMRKVFADWLQVLADQMSTWYANLDPSTVDDVDINRWEDELGIPSGGGSGATLQARRAFVQSRRVRGAFTRTRRANLVELFIKATMGASLSLTPDGLSLTAGGLPLLDETTDVSTLYRIVEDIPNFHYQVRIKNTVLLDVPGLTRELTRITPAGITFDIAIVAVP